jgi:formate hydrogenlyase subunit 6/NADH:ubiquinone oxidoreductase subunit I
MDKIALLEKFAEQFGDRENIAFDKYQCARIKNSRSKCRVCTKVCPHEAIKIAGKSFFVNQTSCTGCGACVTACPLGVFSLNNEPYLETATRLITAVEASDGHPMFACEKLLAELDREVEGGAVVAVRCLDSIDEGLICGAVALGAADVTLCHGECTACHTGTGGAVWEVVTESANSLADQWGYLPFASTTDELPARAFEVSAHAAEAAPYDASRREMFTSLRNSAAGFLGTVAGDALSGFGLGSMGLDRLGEELRVRPPALKAFDAPRPVVVHHALFALGIPEVERVEARFWGSIHIEHNKCKGCTMCGVYCPTGALAKRKHEPDENGATPTGVQFTPSLCAQCGLCQDACRFYALKFEPSIDAAELAADEPRFLDINRS